LKELKEILLPHIYEALNAVLPIVLVIIALCFTVAPMPNSIFISFLVGAALLISGMSLFTMGVQAAMIPIGERIGTYITKSRKLWLLILISFTIGVFITISEPDLQVLANQILLIPNAILVVSVAVGVGLFLVVALLRMLLYIPISHILTGCYLLVFTAAAFVPPEFLAVAFDAGGAVTGPMTVPFILALGLGVAAIRSDKHASNDTFGLVALSSVGPILAVMALGLIYKPDSANITELLIADPINSREVWQQFTDWGLGFPHFTTEIAIALSPVAVFFLFFNFIEFKMNRHSFLKVIVGLLYTFVGLVLFLTGVNVGFMPAGQLLGELMAGLSYNWVIVPIAMLIGYFIVTAEPAVHILNKQVEEISSGMIPAQVMKTGLALGVCISLGLSMLRLMFHIPIIWLLAPGYFIALVMAFFVPKIFTAIAFDSGGVVAGVMTTTFLLPLTIGVCGQLGGDMTVEAFGVIAMVAMTPLITIQCMGLVYKIRMERVAGDEDRQMQKESASIFD